MCHFRMTLVLAGFSALNEDSSSSSVVELPQKSAESAESTEFDLQELQELDPRAEEEATLSSYNDALRNYGADEFEAAERLFHDVLDSKFLAYCRHYGATTTGLDKEKTGPDRFEIFYATLCVAYMNIGLTV